MRLISDVKIADIHIVEVPQHWKNLAPNCEISSDSDCSHIKLVHKPSGIEYFVKLPLKTFEASEVARFRAEAKIAFINKLDGSTN